MVERLTRPRPTVEPLSVLPDGVGAGVLTGELAMLRAEPLMKLVFWTCPSAFGSTACLRDGSCPIHVSQRTQPRKVAMLAPVATETGETRCW